MNILITGHQGFVGRHFHRYFTAMGYTIHGVDLKSGQDCRDLFRRRRGHASEQHYDLVIHCAAVVGGRELIEGQPLQIATDLAIDSDMFNWAVRTKQPRIVYFSSSAAYPIIKQGQFFSSVLKERDIDLNDVTIGVPDSMYGWVKVTGEMLARYVNDTSDTKVYVFRPFSGYGVDQDLTYPFPSFINRIRQKSDPFEIWGDGTQSRDFVHIDDIVQTVLRVIEEDYTEPVNIASGIKTSFNDLADLMFQISGWAPPSGIKHLRDKPVGVHARVGDPTLMHQFYKPTLTLQDRIKQIFNEPA
jgi:nucleoside-diphosphate-sugar epimerase